MDSCHYKNTCTLQSTLLLYLIVKYLPDLFLIHYIGMFSSFSCITVSVQV